MTWITRGFSSSSSATVTMPARIVRITSSTGSRISSSLKPSGKVRNTRPVNATMPISFSMAMTVADLITSPVYRDESYSRYPSSPMVPGRKMPMVRPTNHVPTMCQKGMCRPWPCSSNRHRTTPASMPASFTTSAKVSQNAMLCFSTPWSSSHMARGVTPPKVSADNPKVSGRNSSRNSITVTPSLIRKSMARFM